MCGTRTCVGRESSAAVTSLCHLCASLVAGGGALCGVYACDGLGARGLLLTLSLSLRVLAEVDLALAAGVRGLDQLISPMLACCRASSLSATF